MPRTILNLEFRTFLPQLLLLFHVYNIKHRTELRIRRASHDACTSNLMWQSKKISKSNIFVAGESDKITNNLIFELLAVRDCANKWEIETQRTLELLYSSGKNWNCDGVRITKQSLELNTFHFRIYFTDSKWCRATTFFLSVRKIELQKCVPLG